MSRSRRRSISSGRFDRASKTAAFSSPPSSRMATRFDLLTFTERSDWFADRQLESVVPHDGSALLGGVVEVLQGLEVGRGIRESFDVGVIRAHADVGAPQQFQQAGQFVFIERRYADV